MFTANDDDCVNRRQNDNIRCPWTRLDGWEKTFPVCMYEEGEQHSSGFTKNGGVYRNDEVTAFLRCR